MGYPEESPQERLQLPSAPFGYSSSPSPPPSEQQSTTPEVCEWGRVDFAPLFASPPPKAHLNVICISLAYSSTHPPSAPGLSCPGRGPSRLPLSNSGAAADSAAANQRPDRDPPSPRGAEGAGPATANPRSGRPWNEVTVPRSHWRRRAALGANREAPSAGQGRARQTRGRGGGGACAGCVFREREDAPRSHVQCNSPRGWRACRIARRCMQWSLT